ncbi:MAG: flagellar biosynthesis protein FlhB [Proteobacteria bacterium]|jgi:flagellar biosynthetic protein FlhB|nr:flagellar biosynthesis protein FlhB [Pseudomonadota bacterium]MDA0959022.1 flagellar biosynthesis protein FlhB [Pseudomonadota bacterium]MDA1207132.1 flagellar biosynthesis protein FlhB [Pseudomonadota bacterium]
MAEDNSQQKTEEPTERRLQESRKKGQTARSKELNTLLSLMAAAIGMVFLGQYLMADLFQLMSQGLGFEPQRLRNPDQMFEAIRGMAAMGLGSILPLFGLLVFAAFLGPVAMGGMVFSFEAVAPKLEKISPIKGLGRMFGLQSLVELIKALCKFLLVGAAAVVIIYYSMDSLIGLGFTSVFSAVVSTGDLLLWSFIGFSAVLILVASIDVPFQLWNHKQQLMMTLQEVKDEMKESEGRPEVKSQVRRMQRQLSESRMMDAVPMADVVITNPTHYAVALKYDQDGTGAPKVVAKGQDFMAKQIREVAAANDVPLFEAPPLARALHGMVEIGHEIPGDLFKAVAQVLAYVYQLKTFKETQKARPVAPSYFDVPAQYRGDIA